MYSFIVKIHTENCTHTHVYKSNTNWLFVTLFCDHVIYLLRKLCVQPLVTTNNNLSFKINVVDITFFFETFFFLLNISLETFEWYNFHFWDHIFLLTFTLLSPQIIFKFSWIFFNYRSSLNKLHLSTTKLKKKKKKKKIALVVLIMRTTPFSGLP